MKKLENKVALVTGASKGIGAAIANKLAAAGAKTVVNYLTAKEAAEKIVAEIERNGGTAIAIQGDVSNPSDISRLCQKTLKSFGPIDILVNNAGVYQFGAIEQVNEAEFHRHFNTNVLGLLLTTQGALNCFNEAGGSIINIGSTITRLTPAYSSVYSASKASIEAITQVLSKELGPKNIRVNSINPGMVETEGTRSGGIIGSPFELENIRLSPLGRIGQPDDIGDIAVFLATADSRWLTGEILLASGGVK